MAQPGEEGALALETGTVGGLDDEIPQDLHRDVPVQHEVARLADDAHPAVPEVGAQKIPAPECWRRGMAEFGHGSLRRMVADGPNVCPAALDRFRSARQALGRPRPTPQCQRRRGPLRLLADPHLDTALSGPGRCVVEWCSAPARGQVGLGCRDTHVDLGRGHGPGGGCGRSAAVSLRRPRRRQGRVLRWPAASLDVGCGRPGRQLPERRAGLNDPWPSRRVRVDRELKLAWSWCCQPLAGCDRAGGSWSCWSCWSWRRPPRRAGL